MAADRSAGERRLTNSISTVARISRKLGCLVAESSAKRSVEPFFLVLQDKAQRSCWRHLLDATLKKTLRMIIDLRRRFQNAKCTFLGNLRPVVQDAIDRGEADSCHACDVCHGCTSHACS